MTTQDMEKKSSLTKWIMSQPRKCLLDTFENIERYVNHAIENKNISIFHQEKQFRGVVFHWNDWIELIEFKDEQHMQQYPFSRNIQGDAMFIGEVFGKREYILTLYKHMVKKHPQIERVPLYTYRRGKLIRLKNTLLLRFLYHGKGAHNG
jgi:hypothetical protein